MGIPTRQHPANLGRSLHTTMQPYWILQTQHTYANNPDYEHNICVPLVYQVVYILYVDELYPVRLLIPGYPTGSARHCHYRFWYR